MDQEVIRVRLTVTKAQARKMTRVARWEKASADTSIDLAPRQRDQPDQNER